MNRQIIRFFIQFAMMAAITISFFRSGGQVGTFVLGSILLVGVFFCGWMCPFGSMQEWIGRIGRMLRLPQFKLSGRLQKYAYYMRYIIYALGIIGFLTFTYNPRGGFGRMFQYKTLPILVYIFIGIFLVLSLVTHRPYCNYFCEKGASFGLLGMLRFFAPKRDKAQCIHCHKCTGVCPMHIDVEGSEFINHPQCITCMECMDVCPVRCILFKSR